MVLDFVGVRFFAPSAENRTQRIGSTMLPQAESAPNAGYHVSPALGRTLAADLGTALCNSGAKLLRYGKS